MHLLQLLHVLLLLLLLLQLQEAAATRPLFLAVNTRRRLTSRLQANKTHNSMLYIHPK